MDELEEQRRNETQKLRDEIRKKENRLKMARQKAIVEVASHLNGIGLVVTSFV